MNQRGKKFSHSDLISSLHFFFSVYTLGINISVFLFDLPSLGLREAAAVNYAAAFPLLDQKQSLDCALVDLWWKKCKRTPYTSGKCRVQVGPDSNCDKTTRWFISCQAGRLEDCLIECMRHVRTTKSGESNNQTGGRGNLTCMYIYVGDKDIENKFDIFHIFLLFFRNKRWNIVIYLTNI